MNSTAISFSKQYYRRFIKRAEELPSSALIFENHLIVTSFEANRYMQPYFKSVTFLTVGADATVLTSVKEASPLLRLTPS